MYVIQIATEYAPYLKVGGLADVISGISQQLARENIQVSCILPFCPSLKKGPLKLTPQKDPLVLWEKNRWHNNTVWQTKQKNVELIFLEAHHPDQYFSRERIYGYPDDLLRFLYFSRTAMEYLLRQQRTIDTLHIHDWHSSICPVIYKDVLKQHQLKIKKIVLTVHNFHYQGKGSTHDLDHIGLNGASYLTQDKLQDNDAKYPNSINLLKGGIIYSDVVTTVSPTYAKEILQTKGAFGLETTLKTHRKKLIGILNGIDEEEWDPQVDSAISYPFSKEDSPEKVAAQKALNKQALQKEVGLSIDPTKCLMISIGRLVHQKGPELIESAIKTTLDAQGQFILCGSAADESLQDHFNKLQRTYQKNPHVHFHFQYNEQLTRKMFASADFIVIPSRFEPCGLTQLIAMKYGCIPIVRKTGGLSDTVFDVKETMIADHLKNGYVFEEYDTKQCVETVKRALEDYQHSYIKALSHKVLQLDFSWKKPVQKYLQIF